MESLDKMSATSNRQVAYIFNEMRHDYDELKDLWYAWLFSRLHYIIVNNVISGWRNQHNRALDIGCGTGFQSFLYAVCGARVTGIDIAEELINVAKEKATKFKRKFPLVLFPSYFDFVDRYNALISEIIRGRDAY